MPELVPDGICTFILVAEAVKLLIRLTLIGWFSLLIRVILFLIAVFS
jgi:hypothetical protein